MRTLLVLLLTVVAASAQLSGWMSTDLAKIAPRPTTAAYTPHTAGFHGTNAFTRGTFNGAADTKVFTFSGWIDLTGGDGADQIIFATYSTTSARFSIARNSGNNITLFGRNSGTTTILSAASSVTKTASDGWFHLYICINLANSSQRKIYFDGIEDASVTWTTYTDDTIDLVPTSDDYFWGQNVSGASRINASTTEWWFDDIYLDSPGSFASGGKPINIGTTGELPTGSAPAFYYSKNGSGNSWAVDSSGNGNNGTVTGTLSSPSPP